MRFTISEHRQGDATHYDLFFERDGVLKTWKASSIDFTVPREVEQSADHRAIYLDFEGPISGNRGDVRIVESGTCDLLEWTDRSIALECRGSILRGIVRLECLDPLPRLAARWRISQAPRLG